MRVCVVGGGTAGSEAALEASTRGAEVTIVERDERPSPPWRSWPDLVRPLTDGPEPSYELGRGDPSSWAEPLEAEAKSAGLGCVTTTHGNLRCDFLILATGSSFVPPTFRGARMPGVHVLDSARACGELGRGSGSMSRVVLSGEGGRCLEVADRLSGGGRDIRVLASHWQRGRPPPPVFDVIREAASERGISVTSGTLTCALGTGGVEAVVSDGAVTPCDSVVLVPRRTPRAILSKARIGALGGVLVDRSLRTSDRTAFAAGGCAELEGGAATTPWRASLPRPGGSRVRTPWAQDFPSRLQRPKHRSCSV